MAKSRFSFEKRRKEKEKKAKKEAKREARAERKAEGTVDAVPIVELDEWGNPVVPEADDDGAAGEEELAEGESEDRE